MDLHHGEIRVFSKGEGTGCTFTVDLPMTRKIEPSVAVNHTRRRSTRDRIVGLIGTQSFHRQSTSPPALIPVPQHVNNQAAVLHALPAMNRRHSSPFNQRPTDFLNHRFTSPMVTDDLVPSSKLSSGALINSKKEIRSGGSVMSTGRQSLRDLAEHDRSGTNTARQPKATVSLHKQSTDRYSFSTSNLERRDASGGGPTMSSPLLRDEHTRDDDVVAVGTDHAAVPPSQQLRPAATTMVTSSSTPVPARALSPLFLSAPAPLSAMPSPKSPKQSQNEQRPPQGPVYRILVVDDSSMTRKMLLKTLRNGGLTHPLNTLDISSHLSNALNTTSKRTFQTLCQRTF